jgi:hypothetical protein
MEVNFLVAENQRFIQPFIFKKNYSLTSLKIYRVIKILIIITIVVIIIIINKWLKIKQIRNKLNSRTNMFKVKISQINKSNKKIITKNLKKKIQIIFKKILKNNSLN